MRLQGKLEIDLSWEWKCSPKQGWCQALNKIESSCLFFWFPLLSFSYLSLSTESQIVYINQLSNVNVQVNPPPPPPPPPHTHTHKIWAIFPPHPKLEAFEISQKRERETSWVIFSKQSQLQNNNPRTHLLYTVIIYTNCMVYLFYQTLSNQSSSVTSPCWFWPHPESDCVYFIQKRATNIIISNLSKSI